MTGAWRCRLAVAAALVTCALLSPVAAAGGDRAADPTFDWPAQGRLIVPLCRHSEGIDLALSPGAEIRAAASGQVAYAGSELKNFPNLVLIRHRGGWVSAYANNDAILVGRGDKIKRGQVIATAGQGSIAGRPFHFELRHGARTVDPLAYLKHRSGTSGESVAAASGCSALPSR